MNAPLSTLLQTQEHARPRGIVALCGGGGKTTLMYALAAEAAAQGISVVCSTTTRVMPPIVPAEVRDCLLSENSTVLADFIARAQSPVFVAHSCEARNGVDKLRGLPPETLDTLAERFPAHLFLVEADGAARKPIKAPAEYEPVFPSRTVLAIAVVGLEIFSRPFSAELAHRPERVQALTGFAETAAPLSLAAIHTLVEHPQGLFQHCPSAARRVVFGNKAEAFLPPAGWSWAFGSATQGWMCLPTPNKKAPRHMQEGAA